jgi:hypothetical protein
VSFGLVLALAPLPAPAQSAAGPDATDFALAWALGRYASPVTCRFPDGAKRGLRRVTIEPGPKTSERRVVRVEIDDLGAQAAERCTDELGREERNVVGVLDVTHRTLRPRSAAPKRDFEQERERGPIEYPVERGRLRIGPATSPVASLEEKDLVGGVLRLSTIPPGSDDARRLADIPSTRQLQLVIEAKDGTRIEMPLVQLELR